MEYKRGKFHGSPNSFRLFGDKSLLQLSSYHRKKAMVALGLNGLRIFLYKKWTKAIESRSKRNIEQYKMEKAKSPHTKYCQTLRRIGKKLGYDIHSDSQFEKVGYHLANPDGIWYQSINPDLAKTNIIPENIPLIVFEVLYSEKEKNMRGSLASFMLRDAYRGVFVLLKRENESEKEYHGRMKYLNNIINKFGSNRLCIWEDTDVDKLAEKLGVPT